MTQIQTHTNSKCLKCGGLEEEMLRIGCLVMCEKCTEEEFPKFTVNRDTYSKWLKIYMEASE